MQISDYHCNSCNKYFKFYKKSILENFPKNPKCENCKSIDTNRMYSVPNIDCSYAGKAGNAKNGYTSTISTKYSNFTGKISKKQRKRV